MTYCVGLKLQDGLVMMADTRTNAGLDNIATFRKLTVLERPGDRVIGLMTAGNLAVSQAIINMVTDDGVPGDEGEDWRTLYDVTGMLDAAHLVGRAVREVYKRDGGAYQMQAEFGVSIIMGGQVQQGQMRLFQIYSAGNFIEATEDTPYLQIGEHKYGKPILDRVAKHEKSVADGLKLALISMDSTMRSNLSVGLPIDLIVYQKDSLRVGLQHRINEDDEYFRGLRQAWSDALAKAYLEIPSPDWAF